jgi:DNA topoisomerase IB
MLMTALIGLPRRDARGRKQYRYHPRWRAERDCTSIEDRRIGIRPAGVRFHFRGKSGVFHHVSVDDPAIAHIVRRCRDLPGQSCFNI